MSSDDADDPSGQRDSGPADETVFAAQKVLRNLTYLESTRNLAKRISNVEERDEALKRCAMTIDSIATVENGTYGIIRFEARTTKCPVAITVLDCVELASQIKKHLQIMGDCYLIEDAFSDQLDSVRSNVIALVHNLANLPALPSDDVDTFDSWMPPLLLPSPRQMTELKQRIERLSENLKIFEREMVGLPIKVVAVLHSPAQTLFVELLSSIEAVGYWNSGEGAFIDGPEPLALELLGWPKVGEAYLGWADYGPSIYWELIHKLINTGVVPPQFNGSLRLVFDDLCFKQPSAVNDVDNCVIASDDRLDVLAIPDGARFKTLNELNGPVSTSYFREDGEATTFASLIEYYADEISMFRDELAVRRTPDGRHYRIDLDRIAQYSMPGDPEPKEGYYPDDLLDSDVFKSAFELEGLTGVRLAEYGDPVWLLMQHRKYKNSVASFGETATFREYMHRLYGERLVDSEDVVSKRDSDSSWLEQEAYTNEMLAVDDEIPQVRSVVYTPSTGEDGDEIDSEQDELSRAERVNNWSDTTPKQEPSLATKKAKAAYEYALTNIDGMGEMTAPELFDALLEDGEVASLLPPSADTWRRYLNRCGIKLKKGSPPIETRSIVPRSKL